MRAVCGRETPVSFKLRSAQLASYVFYVGRITNRLSTMKYFLVIVPLVIQLLSYHNQADSNSCSQKSPLFPRYGLPLHQVITVTPDQPATVSCHIYCNGTNWSGCRIRPNAIVVVPQENYSTFEICNISKDSRRHFDKKDYNVTATCDLNGIESETLCGNPNSELTYNITLNGFANSTLRKFVIVCALSRNFSLTPSEHLLMVNSLHHQVAIIQVREIEVISEQINLHPALNVKEGDDVLITCARTPETISEWRFSVKQSNGDKIKLLLPEVLEQMNIKAQFSDGDIDMHTRLQNFSIILINVKVNMTGIAIECGAKSRSSPVQTHFYHKAAVLIVNIKGSCDGLKGMPHNSAESDSFVTRIAVALVTAAVLTVLMLTSVAGYAVDNRNNWVHHLYGR